MTSRAFALSREELIRTLTAYSGITSADGAADGTTLVDSNLIDNASISPSGIPEKTVLILSGNARGEDKGAASFDNVTGEITLQGTGFSAQILAGTIYRILNFSSVETLLSGLISFSGTTTADGGALGSSLICAGLGAEADFDGNQVVITTGDYRGQARDINGITTGGTVSPHLNFGGVIVEGTEFIITAMRTVPAEVAELAAQVGDMDDAATSDDMSDITTTSALAKLRLILNRLSTDAFTATIQGAARTELDTMLAQIAIYFAAAGAAMTANMQGAAKTTINDQMAAIAAYFATGGAVIAATVDPGGTARATLELILEDLGKMLAGAGGITTYPAAASPGNGADIAGVLRGIVNSLTGSDTYTAYTNMSGAAVASINAAFQAIATAIGIDGANTFSATIGGVARTTIEAAFTGIGLEFDAMGAATGIFHEQADVAFNVNAVLAAEADIFDLSIADTRYIIRSLRLKCVDPVLETVTVRLYELVNDGLTEVDSFEITTANSATYHSLMDMFGMAQLAGDNLKVTVQATAAGPYACTGQYSHAKTNV